MGWPCASLILACLIMIMIGLDFRIRFLAVNRNEFGCQFFPQGAITDVTTAMHNNEYISKPQIKIYFRMVMDNNIYRKPKYFTCTKCLLMVEETLIFFIPAFGQSKYQCE